MRNVEIIRKHSNLRQEQWQFMYLDTRHALILTNYQYQSRPTPRHKFRAHEWWDAYRDGRNSYEGSKLNAVPLPEDVTAEAIQVFTASLRVTKGFEEVR